MLLRSRRSATVEVRLRSAVLESLEYRRLLSGEPSSDPDDQLSEAMEVTPPVSALNGVVNAAIDVDMFRVGVADGATLSAKLFGDFDRRLRLFDDAGTELASDGAVFFQDFALIQQELAAGTYYLGVSGLDNLSYDAVTGEDDTESDTGDYSLSLDVIPQDQDDQIAEAVPYAVGDPAVIGEIENQFDVDVFAVEGEAGRNIQFRADIQLGFFDPRIALFTSDGTFINSAGGFFDPAVLNHTPVASETLYVAVSDGDNSGYDVVSGADGDGGGTGRYLFSATLNDPDDQVTEELGDLDFGPAEAAITEPEDVDLYRVFTPSIPTRYAFDLDRPSGGTLDSYLRVFRRAINSDLVSEVASNNNGAAPGESLGKDSYVEFTLVPEFEYFVGVSGNPNRTYDAFSGEGDVNGSIGHYILAQRMVEDADDQADGAEASPTPYPANITNRSIAYDIDVDMYRFIVPANTTLQFDIDHPSGSALDSYLRLLQGNAVRTQLAASDNTAAPGESSATREAFIQYRFLTTGEYFVAVSAFPNALYDPLTGEDEAVPSAAGGAYHLSITQVASPPPPTTGDSDDQIVEARTIGMSAPRTNQSIGTRDVDMYKFTVSAGQRVAFDVDRTTGNLDSYLRLFRSNGQQLAANDDGRAPGESASASAYLEHTFITAGTYYMAVSGDPNRSYNPSTGSGDATGSTGGYSLFLANRASARPAPAAAKSLAAVFNTDRLIGLFESAGPLVT